MNDPEDTQEWEMNRKKKNASPGLGTQPVPHSSRPTQINPAMPIALAIPHARGDGNVIAN